MLYKKKIRKSLFYFVFFLFIIWIIEIPNIPLSHKDGAVAILVLFLLHSWIEKKYYLRQISTKYKSQKVFLKNLFMNCPDLIYQKDSNLKYIDCNPNMKKMLNIDSNFNVAGKTDFDFLPEETAQTIRKYDYKVIENAQVVSYKIEKKNLTGETKIYDTLLAPIIKNNKVDGVLGIMRDITQTELMKEKLLIKNAQVSSILDNIPFMIYLKDIEGRIIIGNQKISQHLNIPMDELIGTNPAEYILRDFKEQIYKEDADVITTKSALISEWKSSLFSHVESWYQVTKSPILDRNNDVKGIIVLIKNIDKEKELEDQKDTLVATLTHDLKTPTAAQMRGMKVLLSGTMGELNDEQREIVELALDSNIYMYNMISTILATYKSESNNQPLEPEEFDFTELVNATCRELSNLAMTKKQNLILKTSLNSKKLYADKLQIKRAITNLVSNAITYGFDNTEIEIILNEDSTHIQFDVKNKSRYISPPKLREIFDKYKSSENAKYNKASTGLGLYLSKQIITAHKGEIHASSEEDGVCTFGFSVPKAFEPAKKKEQA